MRLEAFAPLHLSTPTSFPVLPPSNSPQLIRRGSAFDFAHRSHAMRLEAFAPLRLPRQHAVSDAQPLPSLVGLHVVEVTAAAAAGTYTETAAALSSFADLIAPLVRLSKPTISAGLSPAAASTAAAVCPA
ncbi:unnamed protein product [Closterium sp. Naga37s-1]|nr:unnamed protein product [Closterium sp. Naga37s-1]